MPSATNISRLFYVCGVDLIEQQIAHSPSLLLQLFLFLP